MTDTTTKKPLRVSTNGGAGPYIRVPYSQLDEIRLLLDSRHIRYSVEELIVSFNRGPEIATIDLGRGGDAAAVQAILDSVEPLSEECFQGSKRKEEQTMTDTSTKERLRVLTDGGAGPYIELPFSQLDDVRRLLDSRQIRHWVEEHVISIDGGPEMAVIDLGRGGDAVAVQEILDMPVEQGDFMALADDMAKLGCPTSDEIERIAEAKASRDVLVHNRGVAGKTYEAKAGKIARYKDGQRIDIPEHYHRETWELIRKVITDISNAAIAKFP